ncbi:TPA: hypothetical protein QDB45_001678 [Burkholderia vietnamiensis]|nr:hypothetical protein [Burkholderia vietnamiensis]
MKAPATKQAIIDGVKKMNLNQREEDAVLVFLNAGPQTVSAAFSALKCYDGLDDEGHDPDECEIAGSYGITDEQFEAAVTCSNSLTALHALDFALAQLQKLEVTHQPM